MTTYFCSMATIWASVKDKSTRDTRKKEREGEGRRRGRGRGGGGESSCLPGVPMVQQLLERLGTTCREHLQEERAAVRTRESNISSGQRAPPDLTQWKSVSRS